jgi:hypothetical protein
VVQEITIHNKKLDEHNNTIQILYKELEEEKNAARATIAIALNSQKAIRT